MSPSTYKDAFPGKVRTAKLTCCLQISQQLNSAGDFRFPCIRNASIWSQVFLPVGYRIGYSTSPRASYDQFDRRW
jgi:hypothetical protein